MVLLLLRVQKGVSSVAGIDQQRLSRSFGVGGLADTAPAPKRRTIEPRRAGEGCRCAEGEMGEGEESRKIDICV